MDRKIGPIIVLGILCASCTRDFVIEPSGYGTSVELSFFDQGHWWRGGDGRPQYPTEPCINELTVIEERIPHRQQGQVIWQISASAGCVKLSEVQIGRTPGGFDEALSRLPLRIGHMYRATGRADNAAGISKPWLVCPQTPTALRWDDDYWLVDPPRRCRS